VKILTFNTGRTYTENGQRIAATQLESGHVVILDIDRHIDVIFPVGVELTQADIMWAYDRNMYTTPHAIDLPYGAYYDIVNQLRDAATK
tara:strand:+ start:286 stop:552 length:267 start_codon:yes stop_codon:yes gene_type:complete